MDDFSYFCTMMMEEDTFDIRSEGRSTQTDREYENALRPLSFDDFSGQHKVVDNLRVFVEAARLRDQMIEINKYLYEERK